MKYGLHFTSGFITLIDELLNDHYSKYLKREDFLHLFYIIDRATNASENSLVPIPRDNRNNFGRYGPFKQWKLPELFRICEYTNILTSTTYSNQPGNNYCKSYGYTADFINKTISKELEFQFCEISEKTYKVINRDYQPPTDPILLNHYNTIQEIEIDLTKAEEFAKSFHHERFLRTVRDISTIYNNDRIIVKEDLKTGRIFTSFNLMKKELREFCSYKGEPLLSIDLKSSQPYLLASILLNENPDNKEVIKFYDLITQRDLYDWIAEQCGGFPHHTKEEVRGFIKEWFFTYLYKKNQGTNTVQHIIQQEFPAVYKLIKEKKRKEELWLTLQKMESSIFIPVCNQFVSMGCLSVHDSLYFPVSIQSVVLSELKKRFQDFKLINYNITY